MAFTFTENPTVTLTQFDSSKLTGAVEDTYYGISYTNFKTAGNESSNVDAFVIVDDRGGNGYINNLYVNIGSASVPSYVSLVSFVDNIAGDDPITIRLGGIYVGNTKISNADNKLYWLPPENASGSELEALTVYAADNRNGVWGEGTDYRSAGEVTVKINVAAVNDAPVLDVGTDNVTLDEDQDGGYSFSGVFTSLNDVDDSEVTVSLAVNDGQLILNGTDGLGFADADGADGTLVFTGSKEAVLAALNGIQYNPNQDFNGTDQLQVNVSDGDASDTALININVSAVNDAPVNSVPLSTIYIDTGDTDVHVFNDISISDVDAGTGNLTVNLSVNGGALELASTDGLTFVDADGADGTLQFTGSLNDINAALSGLKYTGDEPMSERILTITTSDNGNNGSGGVLVDTDTINIVLQGNMPPALGEDFYSVSDNGITGLDGNSVSGNLLDNDSDFESDAFFITQVESVNNDAIDTDGSDGFAVQGAYGSLLVGSDGSFEYVVEGDSLALGEVVTDTFTYQVIDSNGGVSFTDVNITVTGTNDAPVANDDFATVSDDGDPYTSGDSVSGNVLLGSGEFLIGEDSDVDNNAQLSVVGIYGEDDIQVEAIGAFDTDDGSFGKYTANLLAQDMSFTDVDVVTFDNNAESEEQWTYINDAWLSLNTVVDNNQFFFASSDDAFVSPDAADDNDTYSFDTTWTFNGENLNAFAFSFAVSSELAYDGLQFFHSTDGVNYSLVFATTDLFETYFQQYQYVTDLNALYTFSDIDSLIAADDSSNQQYFGGQGNQGNLDIFYELNGAGEDDDLLSGQYVGFYEQGTHYFKWSYTKDGSVSSGNDAAYVSNIQSVEIIPNAAILPIVDNATVSGAYGSLLIDSDGSYEYTVTNGSLDDGDVYTETFTYVVSDENGATDTATLNITVTGSNDAPEASDTSTSLNEDAGTVIGSITDNVIDVDTSDEHSLFGGARTAYGQYGYVSFASDGSYTYTVTDQSLGADESYTESFSYVVTDGDATDSASLYITVNGNNDAPEASADTNSATDDSNAATGNVLANDSDIDTNDVLSVVSVNGVAMDSDGSTVYTGSYGNLTINVDGGYSYTVTDETIDTGFVFTENFDYIVADDNGATDTATLNITVTGSNDAPEASDTSASLNEDEGTVSGSITDNVSDVDTSDEHSLFGGARTAYGQYGYVSFASDGSYTYTVTDQSLGADESYTESFSYVVTDGDATDSASLYITVNGDNDAPELDFDTDTVLAEQGEALNLFNGTDGLVSISDRDVNDQITLNVFVSNGVLAFADTDINVLGDLDGSDGELEFTGSIADVNAALAKLVYTPTEHADDVLVVIANDDSGAGNDTVVGTLSIQVNAPDDTFVFDFSDDNTTSINMDPISGSYSNLVITGASASQVFVEDTGDDVSLSQIGTTLTLLNTDYSILDGSTISFADGSVLIANTTGSAATLLGSLGNDQLISGDFGDTLRGLDGNDLLLGGAGKDRMLGGDGDDVLYGAGGNDVLYGGSGVADATDTDIFVFRSSFNASNLEVSSLANGKVTTIYDFTNGQDKIALIDGDLFGEASISDLLNGYGEAMDEATYNNLVTEKDVQGGVQLTFDGGAKILLLGVTAEDIDHNDFIFSSGIV